MRFILKPGGIALLTLALGILSALAFVNAGHRKEQGVSVSPKGTDAETIGKYRLIEAESLGRGETRFDPTASGRKYVHVTGNYEPMAQISCPPGDAFTIWVRVRQTPIQLKGCPEGKQKDYEWSFATPKTFEWVRLGRHTRSELGDTILLIRATGDNTATKDGLDAVVFATEDKFDPNIRLK